MDELIKRLIKELGVDRNQARGGLVALLRAGEIDIVRIGKAHLREEAWWRYGREIAERQAKASRSPKWPLTQSAMNWLGMTISSSPVSPSNAPSSAGFSQPSKVRAPQSRRRPARMVSHAASSGAGTP